MGANRLCCCHVRFRGVYEGNNLDRAEDNLIELGALLGAMIVTLGLMRAFAHENELGAVLLIVFVGGPVVGSLWGAAVGAAIHYTADGTATDAAISLFTKFSHKPVGR